MCLLSWLGYSHFTFGLRTWSWGPLRVRTWGDLKISLGLLLSVKNQPNRSFYHLHPSFISSTVYNLFGSVYSRSNSVQFIQMSANSVGSCVNKGEIFGLLGWTPSGPHFQCPICAPGALITGTCVWPFENFVCPQASLFLAGRNISSSTGALRSFCKASTTVNSGLTISPSVKKWVQQQSNSSS